MLENIYKRRAIIVPYCLLAPGYQAEAYKGESREYIWRNKIMSILLESNTDLVPYTCCETTFFDLEDGLMRKKHGLKYYDTEAYTMYCNNIAQATANSIKSMQQVGYKIVAIMGIEHSPTCAINYIYTNKGTIRRSGIIIQPLNEKKEPYDPCNIDEIAGVVRIVEVKEVSNHYE